MTWYWQATTDNESVEIWDHNATSGDSPTLSVTNPDAPSFGRDPQGVPIQPDVRADILEHLRTEAEAGNTNYALIGMAEALTGAGFEEGTPP